VLLDSRQRQYPSGGGLDHRPVGQTQPGGQIARGGLDAAAGIVDLQGKILGGTSGYYNAGGTLVPSGQQLWKSRPSTWVAAGSLDQQFAASTSASTRARSSAPAASSSSRAT
jgi:hypothetical protein